MKRVGPFIWTNLNPLHWRMYCAKSVWNRSSGSGEEDFLNSVNVLMLLNYYLFLGLGLSFNQSWNLITQECFVPSLFEIDKMVLEKKIFEFHPRIFKISSLSPLDKERDPLYVQTWIPFTQRCIVPSLVQIGPVVLERRIFF